MASGSDEFSEQQWDRTTTIVHQLLNNVLEQLENQQRQINFTAPTSLQLYQLGCLLDAISNSHDSLLLSSMQESEVNKNNYPRTKGSVGSSDMEVQSGLIKLIQDSYSSCNIYLRSIPYRDRCNLFDDLVLSIVLLVERHYNQHHEHHAALSSKLSDSDMISSLWLLLQDISKALASLVQLYHHSSTSSSSTTTRIDCERYHEQHWTMERLTIILKWYNTCCIDVSSYSNIFASLSSTTSTPVEISTRIKYSIYAIVAYCIQIIPSSKTESILLNKSNSKNINDEGENGILTNLERTVLIIQLLHEWNHWDTFTTFMNEKYNPNWGQQLLHALSLDTLHDKSNNSEQQQYYVEYLQSILSAVSTNDGAINVLPEIQHIKLPPKAITTTAKVRNKPSTSITAKVDEIQKRINQVKMILPQYGDGFIEIALSCYKNNAEETISILSSSDDHKKNWAKPLQNISTTLPRRHMKQLNNEKEELESKEITKAAIQAAEEQAKIEAQMLTLALSSFNDNDGNIKGNEYDDDYDDQYDDIIVSNVNDVQLYDNDNEYKAIMTYNRAMKQVESDEQYWESERNTNHRIGRGDHTKQNDDTAQIQNPLSQERQNAKQYRGPDLLRGGRTPGGRHSHGRGGGRTGGRLTVSGQESAMHQISTSSNNTNGNKNQSNSNNANTKPTPSNLRHKARVLDKRRDHQKKAQVKRTGL